MAHKKTFQELDLSNAFLFAAALENPETCRLVLHLLLGIDVGAVNVKAERTMLYSSDVRSVRFDIYASDEMDVSYNIEMQNQNEGNLPKRSRYHQAEMDFSSLKPGQTFNDLKPSMVLFVCTFDPFGKSLYRYTFEERCLECDIPLGDETKKIFLSTKGNNESEVPAQLVHFLRYVEHSTQQTVEAVNDEDIRALHEKIVQLKQDRLWEEKYMSVEELLEQEHREAFQEGHSEGLKEVFTLINAMKADGKETDIEKLQSDSIFYKQMVQKYLK